MVSPFFLNQVKGEMNRQICLRPARQKLYDDELSARQLLAIVRMMKRGACGDPVTTGASLFLALSSIAVTDEEHA
jgi:hypothetical protein